MCKMGDHQSGISKQVGDGLGRTWGITLQVDPHLGVCEWVGRVCASEGSIGYSGWAVWGTPCCEPLQVFPKPSKKALPAFCQYPGRKAAVSAQ